MASAKTILDLPSELIAHIARHLESEDLFRTRLASRHIERSSFAQFGKRFFRKKGYLLWTPSLTVLLSVARHTELRKYVQHIWFNPDFYTWATPLCVPDGDDDDDLRYDEGGLYFKDDEQGLPVVTLTPEEKAQYEAYRAGINDHHALMADSCRGLQMILTEAMSLLPNLVVIGMRRSEDHGPWGWERLRDAVGQDPRVLGPIPSGPLFGLSAPTRLFLSLLRSMAGSNAQIKRLYTDAIEIDNIKPCLLPQTLLGAACKSILYLEVNAAKAWLASPERWESNGDLVDYITLNDRTGNADGIVRLLKATPLLRELGLQIFRDRRQSFMVPPRARDSESWRQSYPYLCLENIVHGVHLQHLSRLKLEKVTTSPPTLIAFLRPMQHTLTSLKIRDVRLLSTNDSTRPWRPVFTFLRDSCPGLTYLLLYHLLYESGGVSFVKDPPQPLPPLQTDPMTGAPNPPFGEPAGDELFIKYDHIALEARGADAVGRKLAAVVEQHWYHSPIFSYAMDEELWHTDTSDEEW